VLFQKASRQHWQPSISSWLYTTARRIAARARLAAQRRSRRERGAARPEGVPCLDQITGREAFAILDEELARLPALYRDPLVLCYLQGLTRDEAAARVGAPLATLKSQLARGRKKLADALTRRGCELGAGLLAVAVTTSPARASSPRLVQAILATVSGTPPAAVAQLAKGISVNALVNRSIVGLGVLAAVLLGVGMAALSLRADGQQTAKGPPAKGKDAAPTPHQKKDTLSVRVLGPAGKPVAGAELLLVESENTPKKLGVTGADGRFSVPAPRTRRVVLLARAPDLGIDFINLGKAPPGDIELRLVKDHPIRGRVITTEGKPVAGVTVTVTQVAVYKGNSLDPFLAVWNTRPPGMGVPPGIADLWHDRVFPATKTDREGRFTFTGTGAERLVTLRLHGAGIADMEAWVANRPGLQPRPAKSTSFTGASPLFGPNLSLVCEREKPIRGVVTDRDTGTPRPGARLTLWRSGNLVPFPLFTTTDNQGRFEFRGVGKARGYTIEIASDPASGYMTCQVRATDTPGYGPLTIDLAVKKGVIITGRVIDRGTGKAIPGSVMAAVLADNPSAKDFPALGPSAWFRPVSTARDGTFRVVTIPGPVLLMGGPDTHKMPEGAIGRLRYKPAVPDPKYPKYFPEQQQFLEGGFLGLGGTVLPLQGNFCKVLMIEPGTRTVKQDVILEPTGGPPVILMDFGPLDK
jgi:hypothetical protein